MNVLHYRGISETNYSMSFLCAVCGEESKLKKWSWYCYWFYFMLMLKWGWHTQVSGPQWREACQTNFSVCPAARIVILNFAITLCHLLIFFTALFGCVMNPCFCQTEKSSGTPFAFQLLIQLLWMVPTINEGLDTFICPTSILHCSSIALVDTDAVVKWWLLLCLLLSYLLWCDRTSAWPIKIDITTHTLESWKNLSPKWEQKQILWP